MARHHRASLGNFLLVHEHGQIIPDRRFEFWLRLKRLNDFRVWLHASHGAVEDRARHAFLCSLAAQFIHAGSEICKSGRACCKQANEGNGKDARDHENSLTETSLYSSLKLVNG